MKLSIRKKTILLILAFAIILITVSAFIYARVIWNVTEEYYLDKADEVARTIAANVDEKSVVRLRDDVMRIFEQSAAGVPRDKDGAPIGDSPEYEAYLEGFAPLCDTDDYKSLHSYLSKMEGSADIDCAYISVVDAKTKSFVYLVDADPEDPCPTGTIDPVYDVNKDVLSDPSRAFPAYVTDTGDYGWLVTAGVAVRDGDDVVGYVMVDISLDTLRAEQFTHVLRLLAPLFLALAFICVLGILIVNRILVDPIKQLSETAADYCEKNDLGGYNGFSKLKINTGDELEALADSMKRMEYDLNEHINELFNAKGEARRSQSIAKEMTEIANTDALTGVRNKNAYDREAAALDEAIDKGDARFGIVMIDLNGLKKTNDTYGHDHGDEMIKGLSAIICETFDNSPVYRVGGDEFVVIAKDAQYDALEALTDKFNERIKAVSSDKSLKPWQRVSAAAGFARFDPENDKKTSATFRRADEAMYERKREMKGKR